MDLALANNDLVHVVELIAANPKSAIKALCDGTGELPLDRARRLGCEPAIIRVLEAEGAGNAPQDHAENINPGNDDNVHRGLFIPGLRMHNLLRGSLGGQ